MNAWSRFFFAPQSPVPLGLFRIAYGTLVALTLMLLRPDWLNWYGPHAWVGMAAMRQVEPDPRLNLFLLLPRTDAWTNALFWVSLIAALSLAAGLLTRLSSVLVFVCLASIQQQNLFILHGGDTFLRVAGFFLMFAPAGAALSADRLIRLRLGRETGPPRPRSPWAQRMIQIELAVLYFITFWTKLQGHEWLQGTALVYVYHLDELRRFPLPSWFLNPALLRLGTWFALVLEFSLGVLVWVRPLRYYILAVGVLFHAGIEYSLNIPLFEWDVMAAYILFVDAADLTRVWTRISKRPA